MLRLQLLRQPPAHVVATVLLVMALVSTGGIVMAAYHGIAIPLATAWPFALSTTVGMVLGRMWGKRIPAEALHTSFAWLLLCVAVAMGLKAYLS